MNVLIKYFIEEQKLLAEGTIKGMAYLLLGEFSILPLLQIPF